MHSDFSVERGRKGRVKHSEDSCETTLKNPLRSNTLKYISFDETEHRYELKGTISFEEIYATDNLFQLPIPSHARLSN